MSVITLDFAQRFIQKYVHAWVICDPDAAILLVSENFRNVWDPIRSPVQGREAYHKLWFDEGSIQEDLEIWWRDPVIDKNFVFCEMWTTMIYHGGEMSNPESGQLARAEGIPAQEVTAVGCSAFDFDASGLCCEIREYRSVSPGRHGAPAAYRHKMTAREELAALGR
ncbi:MAG: nuclear transport factor 2 family protein [Sphingomonadaceae bacterium]